MNNVIFDSTRDENNQFQTGYIVTKGRKYMTIKYLTNWEGKKDRKYRVTIDEWDAIHGDDAHKCLVIENQF